MEKRKWIEAKLALPPEQEQCCSFQITQTRCAFTVAYNESFRRKTWQKRLSLQPLRLLPLTGHGGIVPLPIKLASIARAHVLGGAITYRTAYSMYN